MNEISLIRIDWNNCNGFIFHILNLDSLKFDRSFLGLYINCDGVQIDVLFLKISLN